MDTAIDQDGNVMLYVWELASINVPSSDEFNE